jgi:hypothetical protein
VEHAAAARELNAKTAAHAAPEWFETLPALRPLLADESMCVCMLVADVDLIVSAAAAVGTVLAALVSAFALRTAARAATATERQFAAQTSPMLVEDRETSHAAQVVMTSSAEAAEFSVSVRNVGPGAARVTKAWFGWSEHFPAPPQDNPFYWLIAVDEDVLIPPGESRGLSSIRIRSDPEVKQEHPNQARQERAAWSELNWAFERNRICAFLWWQDLPGLHPFQTQLVCRPGGESSSGRWRVSHMRFEPRT